MATVPALTGNQLIKLLESDGWKVQRNANHGLILTKDGRVAVVKNTNESLPKGTLNAIIGPKQTALGREGLLALVKKTARK